jgi:hypothetical protein
VLHVDLTVPLIILASPLVVLGVLRMVASIADARAAERARSLVSALEQIESGAQKEGEDGATSRSGPEGKSRRP